MKIVAALMLKAPRPGRVKTRLAASVGPARAVAVYRALVEKQIVQIPDSWDTVVHFSPRDAEFEMREWLEKFLPSGALFLPQIEGDLGDRMRDAVKQAFERGAEGVALIGGDCPSLTCEYLQTAAQTAREADVTIAPALDGGYVLMLIRKPHVCLFEGISWSTDKVLAQTLDALTENGLTVRLLPPLEDVDDLGSLERSGM